MNMKYVQNDYIIKLQELLKLFQINIDDFEEDIKILEKLIIKGQFYSKITQTNLNKTNDYVSNNL